MFCMFYMVGHSDKNKEKAMFSRRSFLGGGAALFAASGFAQSREEHRKQGDFDDMYAGELDPAEWTP